MVREDNARSTNVNSSPNASAHAVCQAFKAHVSLDQTLPASYAGGKDSKGNCGNYNGGAGSGSQELDCAPDRDGPPVPPPSGGVTATRVVGK